MTELRIGVIGCYGRGGMSLHWHKPEEGRVVAGAVDVSEGALDWFKNNVNDKAFLSTNYRALLDRDDIDAVAVMSPDFTHEQYVCDAFAAGKHVFSEKPMAITTDGCDRMLKAWVDSGKRFMVGHNMRYMNIFRVMKDAVESGAIGEVKTVWVRHFVGFGGDWYYHDWHGTSKNTTGLLLQKACHDIDMIHWITGKYAKRVTGFGSLDYYGGDKADNLHCPDCPDKDGCVEFQHAAGSASDNKMDLCVFRKEVDVEDTSTIMMELDGGIKATYMQCHYTPDYWRNYVFIGTEGRLENLDDHSKVVLKTRGRSKRRFNLADRELAVKEAHGGHGGADPLTCKDFVDMLLHDKRTVATPLAGRMSVAAGCAGTESIRNGSRPVDVKAVPAELEGKVF